MRAEHTAVEMDDLAGERRIRLQLRDDVAVLALRHETNILAIGLLGNDKTHLLGERARLRLGEAAERKAQVVDLLLGGREEEIALVALGVSRPVEGALANIARLRARPRADVVAGRQRVGAELLRGRQQVGELDGLVAGNAWNRRFAGNVALGEGIDHRLAEARLVVEHIMRNAQSLADASGVVNVLAGAAGAGSVHRRTMVVELQSDAENIIAFAFEQPRDHGGVDTAGHGDDDTRIFGLAVKIETVHGIQSGIRTRLSLPASCFTLTPRALITAALAAFLRLSMRRHIETCASRGKSAGGPAARMPIKAASRPALDRHFRRSKIAQIMSKSLPAA
ncbi:hypothetical protein USDA257_c51740 [Sinorhizobium fredii USDA 257]|uniref:Uncharacterized protein n=1 Tax=Sinorhizobium fredii (strain USDA 257) TaxID=1185652 RepID=I3XCU3_SINF2|nr:hypothetical protein USDA257_c51740 [Sinorhizobium fredii USDA 257]